MNIIRVRAQCLAMHSTKFHLEPAAYIVGGQGLLAMSGTNSLVIISHRCMVRSTWCQDIPITETFWGDAE